MTDEEEIAELLYNAAEAFWRSELDTLNRPHRPFNSLTEREVAFYTVQATALLQKFTLQRR